MPPNDPNAPFRQINERNLIGKVVVTDDWALSAQNLGSVLQRGPYTLATGKAFVTFPRPYSGFNNIVVMLTSMTANHHYLESSAISGFTVSGSGSDTGKWLSLGYK